MTDNMRGNMGIIIWDLLNSYKWQQLKNELDLVLFAFFIKGYFTGFICWNTQKLF